jgi:hypothetical protein
MTPSERNAAALRANIRRLVNLAVADGAIEPHDAFATLMNVAATYVAQVKDPAVRAEFIKTIVSHFGHAVDVARADDAKGIVQ